ncbi:MAG TPA: 2-dehydropantoate 2-reductase N-terminal domain-containing protein [Chloroflexota bacterium]|nr:2-dehydropantoate 2-reductase N-terminal domain-containing protein [Chloroflexota bacterium]
MSERVLVYGAGAVGCYLGSRLHDVTLLGRPPVVDSINRQGLIRREDGVEHRTTPRTVTEPPAAADTVLLCVRCDDVAAAIPDLSRILAPGGTVIALQNGVGTEEMLAEAIGRERVIAGTLTVSVGMEEPGTVTRYSRSGGLALASLTGENVPASVMRLAMSTGLPVLPIADYRALRWSKLLLNMLGAPLSAILDVPPAAVMQDPRLFAIEQRAFRETVRAMDEMDIPVVALPGYPTPLARWAMTLPAAVARRLVGPRVARSRGGRAPTMQADLKRGRSEICYLNGAVVQVLGRERAPVNAALTDLVLDLVTHPEQRSRFRHQPSALLDVLRTPSSPVVG